MSLWNAILQCFLDEPERVFGIRELCAAVRKYYQFTPFQEELDPRHPQPRYEHQIRSNVAKAKKLGYIVRLGRSQYRSA